MKMFPCVQGSEEWLRLRLGIPTASEFDRILTPKKWELAAGRRSYQLKLLTELILDAPLDEVTTPAMLHGQDWEPKAKRAYELVHGVDIEECGFCTTDDGLVGASPDAFVGDDGLLEVKCPDKPEIHVGYLLNPQRFYEEHFAQVQGQLYVCRDRKWTDLTSYFMGIPRVEIRVTPDQKYHEALDAGLKIFLAELTDLIESARKQGVRFRAEERKNAPPMPSRDWITDEDAEAILAARRGADNVRLEVK